MDLLNAGQGLRDLLYRVRGMAFESARSSELRQKDRLLN